MTPNSEPMFSHGSTNLAMKAKSAENAVAAIEHGVSVHTIREILEG